MEQALLERVHGLSDLELATLLSLVAGQHCIVKGDEADLDALSEELKLISSRVFGLSHATFHCTAETTLDDFGAAILVKREGDGDEAQSQATTSTSEPGSQVRSKRHKDAPQQRSRPPVRDKDEPELSLANVLIAKELNLASRQVQIQALELIRTRRILTRTAFHNAPKRFLFVTLLSSDSASPPLVSHLNDLIFVSHAHSSEDGFPNLEELNEEATSDHDSMSSVVKKSPVRGAKPDEGIPLISGQDIDELIYRTNEVKISTEIKRYIQNIVIFLRMHRAVDGGISAQATKHFDLLVKCLAPLHSLTFATPSLVALAARKVYPHRIKITTPENERSMQWGSDLEAVKALLEGVTPDDVIDDVLGMVETPL
ncbi:MAG: hypothetical protein M1833_006525 [Piccolia ochrophora]|nr:MAG: hypothetical protein M1833_006525 [Piccolia ochrophora]